MAEHTISLRDNEQAIHHYKEAIKYSPQDAVIMASLAKLYMQMNNMTECQQICAMLLEIDPNNEGASVMMADLSFRRVSNIINSMRIFNIIYINFRWISIMLLTTSLS